jgi:ABC-type polysaccharide/polyol phosphate export permease
MFLLFFNFLERGVGGTSIYILWIIPLFINLFILSLAIALILSNVYIIAKDITQIWQVFTSFLFFLSPVIYRLSTFKKALPTFDYINPIAGIIINARRAAMENTNPDLKLFLFDLSYAILLLLMGLLLLNKLGSKAAEKL